MLYPWHTQQFKKIVSARNENRLPHALLLTGIAGLGKADFADSFTRFMLCEKVKETGNYCQSKTVCHFCRLIEGRAHPNVLWVEPEKDGQAIKIDQIRYVSEFIEQSSFQGEYRMVIIHPANNMNASAANALLKTLEEPSSGALLILIADQAQRLPATIRSRCQQIVFSRPNKALAQSWLNEKLQVGKGEKMDLALLLQLANGAPLAALQLARGKTLALRKILFENLYALSQKKIDPLQAATQVTDIDNLPLTDYLLSWVKDLMRLQLGLDIQYLVNLDYETQLTELKQKTHLQRNSEFCTYLQQLRVKLCKGVNLNKQLMIENLFIKWMATCHATAANF